MDTVSIKSVRHISLRAMIISHPLTTYFIMAYAFAWLAISPAVLGSDGLRLLPVALRSFLFTTLGAVVGPTLAAWVVTYLTRGKAGILDLLRGYVRWKVGLRWYAISLLGFPATYLVVIVLTGGAAPLQTVVQHWPLFFSVYLSALVTNLMLVTFWEEPGWRGFALPRLERMYGPLKGTLLLGLLWALWHLPAYFVTGWLGPFSPGTMIVNILASIIFTILFTWVFNNAAESILMTMLLHASSNATTAYIRALFPRLAISTVLLTFGLWALSAMLVVLFTRGRLAYRNQVTYEQPLNSTVDSKPNTIV